MASDIGINLRVDAQTDGLKQAANDFSAFQEKLASVLGVTDPEKAEAYWQEYNSGLAKATKLADQMSMIEARTSRMQNQGRQGGGGVGGGRSGGDDDNRVIPFPGRGIFTAERSIRGLVSAAPHDAVGAGLAAGESLLEGAMKKFSALPTAAKIATGVGAGIVGVGMIGNALSKQYESVVPDLLEVTAALKRFGATAGEQGVKFKETMREVSETSSKWNFTFQQGAATVERIARMSGGAYYDPSKALSSASSVMRISTSLGYSTPLASLTELAGFASGYGKSDAEKYALGLATATTGSQTTEEVAAAMQAVMGNVFEAGGSISPAQAANTQKWLYDVFGKRAGGQGGAAAFANLSGAVRGATGLGKETDIMLFQAARALSGGDDMKAMMLMEQGFSPELFGQFKQGISGGSAWDQIYLTSKAFGVSKTVAKQMLDGTYKGDVTAMSEAAGAINATPERGIVGAQEKIAQELRAVGDEALNIKYAVLNGTAGIIHAILHPESSEFAMTPVNAKGNTGVNKAEMQKAFGSLILAGSPVAGFGGDMLESQEWAAMRFPSDVKKGKSVLAFLTEALHNDSFMSKVSPDLVKSWASMDETDKRTPWAASEATNLYNSVMSEAVRQGFIKEIVDALKKVNITIEIPPM